MTRTVHVCDVCGTEQATTNHWFVIVLIDSPRALWLGELGSEAEVAGEFSRVFHLCGEACVSKKVSEFLGQRE